MKRRKGLVYDSQKGFSRFVKNEFKKEYTFDVYNNFENFDDNLDEFTIMVFIIYSDLEVLDLMRIYKKGVPLIVSTVNKDIRLKLEKLDDLLLFDASKVKSDIREDLKFCFNISV